MTLNTSMIALRQLRRQAAEEPDPEKLKAIAVQILRWSKKKQFRSPARQWTQPILALRKNLNLTQGQLAAKLNCSAMAISRWERGHRPPTRCLIELGKLMGKPDGWILWNLAGLTIEDVRKMI
jgi:DNA-binding transcriptional regulator YiaG